MPRRTKEGLSSLRGRVLADEDMVDECFGDRRGEIWWEENLEVGHFEFVIYRQPKATLNVQIGWKVQLRLR